jgi:dynein heavy chain, axonemal
LGGFVGPWGGGVMANQTPPCRVGWSPPTCLPPPPPPPYVCTRVYFQTSDGSVVFGELNPDLLALLDSQLTEVYRPLLKGKADWGAVSEPRRDEFTAELLKFCGDMGEALRSIGSGIELEHPSAQYDLEAALRDPLKYAKAHPDMVRHLETLLEGWCEEIDAYVNGEDGEDVETVDGTGPRGVIEWWRSRTQKLTSITEQLRSKEFRAVVAIMTALVSRSASPSEHVRSSSFVLLRRWKALDVSITEAANESKDNVKYLSTLDKFIQPLYEQTPPQVRVLRGQGQGGGGGLRVPHTLLLPFWAPPPCCHALM